jgi:NADPH-dependent curcumin reductase CurA
MTARNGNLQVLLVAYPCGLPQERDFMTADGPIPRPSDGEILIRSIFLSLDPWQRLRMRDPQQFGRQYGKPVVLNEVIPGAVIGEVVQSRNPRYREGDLVEGKLGWQNYAVSHGDSDRSNDGEGVSKVQTFGLPFSLLDVGRPRPGETVVVSAAAGATGSVAGQIAKILGCRVVGLAGSDEKITFLVKELGFDAALNYKTERDLRESLTSQCPDGVDIYIDNVGGPIADLMLALMNDWARWVVVGHLADYEKPLDQHFGVRAQGHVLARRMRMQGFIVHDYAAQFPIARRRIRQWVHEGRLRYREYIAEGLRSAPRTFIEMLNGANLGKTLVRVGPYVESVPR